MKLVGKPILDVYAKEHADIRGPIKAWIDEVEIAEWKTTVDIKERYRSASFLADNVVVFNIKGNRYRLVVKVSFKIGIVKVEMLGTHAEYDEWYS